MTNKYSSSKEVESLVLGIDLGTTSLRVGVWRDGRVETIPNERGGQSTAACVHFHQHIDNITPHEDAMGGKDESDDCSGGGFKLKSGEGIKSWDNNGHYLVPVVGDSAKAQGLFEPSNTVQFVKRLIGCSYYDPVVQNDINYFPYNVICGPSGLPMIEVGLFGVVEQYTVEEIIAMMLRKALSMADNYLGSSVRDAVIAVPCCFDFPHKLVIKNACIIAGINVVRIVTEPLSAAFAYGCFDKDFKPQKTICFLDIGGGTTNISLACLEEGILENLAVGGDAHLGGIDLENSMIEYVCDQFKKISGRKIDRKSRSFQRVRHACERAKLLLSSETEAPINISALSDGADFHCVITRAKFNELNQHIAKKILVGMRKVLLDCRLEPCDVHQVILSGGSSSVPMIQSLVKQYFPEVSVAAIENMGDYHVSFGASVQGLLCISAVNHDLPNGSTTDMLLPLDVLPSSVGIQLGSGFKVVFAKRRDFPSVKDLFFTLGNQNESECEFEILSATNESDVKGIALIHVENIPPSANAPCPIPLVFCVDSSGLLSVRAEERRALKPQLMKASVSFYNCMCSDTVEELARHAESVFEVHLLSENAFMKTLSQRKREEWNLISLQLVS